MEAMPSIRFSVSATTRPPRSHEKDGEHYHFLDLAAFKQAVVEDKLLEYEEVYPDCFYGTLRSEVERSTDQHPVLLDIDVVGALNVKEQYPDTCLALFIRPPSLEELERRLIMRGTETEESLAERVGKAAHELEYAKRFDHVVTNDDLSIAVDEVTHLVETFVGQG